MASEKESSRSSCAADPKAAQPTPKQSSTTTADPKDIQAAEILVEMSRSGVVEEKEWKESKEPTELIV